MSEFEIHYDADKVRETLRAARERRGVKVFQRPMPDVGRVGIYKRQAEKRREIAESRESRAESQNNNQPEVQNAVGSEHDL